ncbi:unnamed protein product, partial [Nesidiocoris tenuis]
VISKYISTEISTYSSTCPLVSRQSITRGFFIDTTPAVSWRYIRCRRREPPGGPLSSGCQLFDTGPKSRGREY